MRKGHSCQLFAVALAFILAPLTAHAIPFAYDFVISSADQFDTFNATGHIAFEDALGTREGITAFSIEGRLYEGSGSEVDFQCTDPVCINAANYNFIPELFSASFDITIDRILNTVPEAANGPIVALDPELVQLNMTMFWDDKDGGTARMYCSNVTTPETLCNNSVGHINYGLVAIEGGGISSEVVPEPSPLALLGISLLGIVAVRKLKKH